VAGAQYGRSRRGWRGTVPCAAPLDLLQGGLAQRSPRSGEAVRVIDRRRAALGVQQLRARSGQLRYDRIKVPLPPGGSAPWRWVQPKDTAHAGDALLAMLVQADASSPRSAQTSSPCHSSAIALSPSTGYSRARWNPAGNWNGRSSLLMRWIVACGLGRPAVFRVA
jgi:hypothetical protein